MKPNIIDNVIGSEVGVATSEFSTVEPSNPDIQRPTNSAA